MKTFDVMIPAHNESLRQLQELIMAITFQKVHGWRLGRLFICSDNPRIQKGLSGLAHLSLLSQAPGLGKPNALNMMYEKSRAFYALQNSADCIPASENTYQLLLDPLLNPVFGAVTSRPVSFEPGFLWLPDLVWKCHHFVQPKLNAELFSFKRSAVDFLPETVIHDDAYWHNMVVRCGFQVCYEPRAIVFNSAPKTMSEFYNQRKKNVIGNLQLEREFHQEAPSMLRLRSLIVMSVEILANLHGRLDYARGKIPKGLIGYSLESTKEVYA